MRIDLVSIFPEYFAPLALSLPGKARDKGLIDIRVHDLRQWTHDRHHTTDDTPYGGGAGMVMKPEPWGEAFDELGIEGATVVFTTPSGTPFTQELARELAGCERLVFACGRYEGIDQRVVDHAATRADVREISIGDYVLNGGEVAALAITEAVVRLLPGFMGNPESLVEESHEAGLLEYPAYTKPPTWRGLDVPDVLLSGDHARIEAWRHEQAVRRTAERRPDLLHPSRVDQGLELTRATVSDAAELLVLQRACWAVDGTAGRDAVLAETMAEVEAAIRGLEVWVARSAGRLVGAGRGRLDDDAWRIERVMVAPDLQGRGIGRQLLGHLESVAPPAATAYELHVGSAVDLRRLRKAGYRPRGSAGGFTVLTRRRDESTPVDPEPVALDPQPAPELPAGGVVTVATEADAGEFMTLQWASFAPELREPLDILARDITSAPTYLLRIDGRLVGSIRAETHDRLCHLSLLMVAPDLTGSGLGRFLLAYAESQAPPQVTTYQVFTAEDAESTHRFYRAAGYEISGEQAPGVVRMTKTR